MGPYMTKKTSIKQLTFWKDYAKFTIRKDFIAKNMVALFRTNKNYHNCFVLFELIPIKAHFNRIVSKNYREKCLPNIVVIYKHQYMQYDR